jgi:hypothetical protein
MDFRPYHPGSICPAYSISVLRQLTGEPRLTLATLLANEEGALDYLCASLDHLYACLGILVHIKWTNMPCIRVLEEFPLSSCRSEELRQAAQSQRHAKTCSGASRSRASPQDPSRTVITIHGLIIRVP